MTLIAFGVVVVQHTWPNGNDNQNNNLALVSGRSAWCGSVMRKVRMLCKVQRCQVVSGFWPAEMKVERLNINERWMRSRCTRVATWACAMFSFCAALFLWLLKTCQFVKADCYFFFQTTKVLFWLLFSSDNAVFGFLELRRCWWSTLSSLSKHWERRGLYSECCSYQRSQKMSHQHKFSFVFSLLVLLYQFIWWWWKANY